MKKLVVIALALITLNGFAQQKGQKKMNRENSSELRKEMTPNDIADLKSKKLTLRLDLTDKQQKEVHKLILEQSKANEILKQKHQAKVGDKKVKSSKAEFVNMKNEKLDQQIKMKRDMKAILTAEQFAKFEKMPLKQQRKKGKQDRKRIKQQDNK